MTVQVVIFLIALLAVVYFFKNFNACVYFIVMMDIFFRIVTTLKVDYLRSDAFSFLNFIPESIPSIINSFDLGMFNEILMVLYLVIYIVFEALVIRIFIKKKF